MQLPIFQVDAFSDQVFRGNPAAVVPLERWLDDAILQQIAEENNLSETAFVVAEKDGFALRWFTPLAEVDLCGHATLAAAHVLMTHLQVAIEQVQFNTRSGLLTVSRCEQGYAMLLPAADLQQLPAPEILWEALDLSPTQLMAQDDYIVVLENERQVRHLKPDFFKLTKLDRRGVIVTAEGDSADFVCRCFYPKLRINEDPFTGSAYSQVMPYWAEKSSS